MSVTKRIKVGVLGLGRAGWNLHLRPMFEHDGFSIVAVADPLEERRQEAFNLTGCRDYPDLRTLLQKSDAELIVIATPSCNHYADAKAALLSGRHVIVEKPMAILTTEADELVEIAKSRSLHLAVNHSHLHYAEYHHLVECLRRGILGPLFHIRTFWANYARRWDWQTLIKNGGGQLNNTVPHVLSIVLPLLGTPVTGVVSHLMNIKDAGDAEDHVHLNLMTESGLTADVVVSSAINAVLPKWILCGRYGTATLIGNRLYLKYYDPGLVSSISPLDAPTPGREYLQENLPWQEECVEVVWDSVVGFHQNVYDVIVNRSAAIVTPEGAAEVVRIINLARQSASFRQKGEG